MNKPLTDQFAQRYNLGASPTPLPDLPALQEMHATLCEQQQPMVTLSPAQREALRGKHLPAHRELLRRLGEALSKHPQISRETHVTPKSCAQTEALHSSASQLLNGAGHLHEATLDALRLVDDQALTQGRHVLQMVHRLILSRKSTCGDPSLLEVRFAMAFSKYEEATQTRAEAKED